MPRPVLINLNATQRVPPMPKLGTRIMHSTFREGTVIARKGSNVFGESLLINFDRHGDKELQWCFAHVKITRLRKTSPAKCPYETFYPQATAALYGVPKRDARDAHWLMTLLCHDDDPGRSVSIGSTSVLSCDVETYNRRIRSIAKRLNGGKLPGQGKG